MSAVVAILLAMVALVLAVPVAVLLIEIVLASLTRPAAAAPSPGPRGTAVVLMPAHDEAGGIAATLDAVRAQLAPGDRLLVVADNCSDATADVARAHGADVIERHSATQRGKGYALDHGVRHLAAAPPSVVVIVDADCLLEAGAFERLVRLSQSTGRPVQASYLMLAPEGASLKQRIAEFAWTVKDHARPLGLWRAGQPCQLMGTGMAFPWSLIVDAPLATGHIVEDLQLGLDLAAAGTPPLFCPQARVTSRFAANAEGEQSQRTRWEHGHLGVLFAQAPRLLAAGLRRGNLGLITLALDLAVPPIALLVLLCVAFLFVSTLAAWAFGGWAWLDPALGLLIAMGAAVGLAWWGFGRQSVSLLDLLRAPAYALWKIPLYLRFLVGRQVEWVRSKRDQP